MKFSIFMPLSLLIFSFLSEAAFAASAPSEESLGNDYENGANGVQLNYANAKSHYLKCVNQGDPTGNCANRLGMLTLNPVAGGSKDGDEALSWLERCKNKGGDCARNYVALNKLKAQGIATIKGVPIHFSSTEIASRQTTTTTVVTQQEPDNEQDEPSPPPQQITANDIGIALGSAIANGLQGGEIIRQRQKLASAQSQYDANQRQRAASAQQQVALAEQQQNLQEQIQQRQQALQSQQQALLDKQNQQLALAGQSSSLKHNGQIATNCLKIEKGTGSYGPELVNHCPYVVDGVWCDTTSLHPVCSGWQSENNFGASGTPGSHFAIDPAERYRQIRVAACKGANNTFHTSEDGFEFQCDQ